MANGDTAVANELPIDVSHHLTALTEMETRFLEEFPEPGYGSGKKTEAIVGNGKSRRHYKYTQSAREARQRAINALRKARREIQLFSDKARILEW